MSPTKIQYCLQPQQEVLSHSSFLVLLLALPQKGPRQEHLGIRGFLLGTRRNSSVGGSTHDVPVGCSWPHCMCLHPYVPMPSVSSCLLAHTHPQCMQSNRHLINCKAVYLVCLPDVVTSIFCSLLSPFSVGFAFPIPKHQTANSSCHLIFLFFKI